MQMNKKNCKIVVADLLYAILKEKSHKREMKEKIIQIKKKKKNLNKSYFKNLAKIHFSPYNYGVFLF